MRVTIAITLIFTLMTALACSQPNGEFFFGTLGLGEGRIVLATQNAGALTVLSYDLEGSLIGILADFTASGDIPKGIAFFDALSLAVLLDGADRIGRISLLGESLNDVTANANLSGTLWQLARNSLTGSLYAIETNTIEGFAPDGSRIGNPFIAATLGSCVLSTPRGIAASSDGRLFSVGTGNDDLNVYDISGSSPACLTANTSFGNIDPVAVLVHSNGLLYVATQGDDRIYSFSNDGTGAATVVWNTNLAQISNPSALLEMPDGSLLVASDLTNNIVRINIDGTIYGPGTFIRDAFTGSVTQMLFLHGL